MTVLRRLAGYLWSKRRLRLPLPAGSRDVLFAAGLGALVLWFGAGWLGDGLPPLDFPGTIVSLEALAGPTAQAHVSQWTDKWFCGAPTVSLAANFMSFAAYVPFAREFDSIQAVKVGGLFFFSVAAVGMYAFLRMLTRRRWAAAIGAAVFALHPIGVSMAVSTGHANFPQVYAAMPLVFAAALAFARSGSLTSLLLFAMVDGVMLWTDNERGAVVTLFAFAFYAAVRWSGTRKRSSARGVAAAKVACGAMAMALLAAWVTAGITVPMYLASKHLSLFTEAEKADSVAFFRLNNPLFLIDRGGAVLKDALTALPERLASNSGKLYLGIAPLVALISALFLSRKRRERALAWSSAVALLVVVWLSAGNNSLYDSTAESLGTLLKRAPSALLRNPAFLIESAALTLSVCLLAVMAWRRSGRLGQAGYGSLPIYIVPLLSAAYLLTTPFVWLGGTIFGNMRSPTWFLSCMPAFALGCGACAFVATILGRTRPLLLRAAIVAAVAAAVVYDFYPYRREFHYYHRHEIPKECTEISSFLSEEKGEGRVLAASSYSPLIDMIIGRSGRENAWGWLNWMSPATAKAYVMGDVYANFRENQTRAAILAGVASVRYLVSYTPDDGFESHTDLLRKTAAIDKFSIYENMAWRPFLQAYPEDANKWKPADQAPPAMLDGAKATLVSREPGLIEAEVAADKPVLLVASESYFPGWRSRVDGAELKVAQFGGAFLCTRVPAGKHAVEFRYRAPAAYYFSYAVSGAFVIIAIVFLAVAALRRLRALSASTADRSRT